MIGTIFQIAALILFLLAGCGIDTVSKGSVTLHTGWFGLACLVLAALAGCKWPCKREG